MGLPTETPRLLLTAIFAIVMPSALILTGWTLPTFGSESTSPASVGAEQGLRAFAGSMDRFIVHAVHAGPHFGDVIALIYMAGVGIRLAALGRSVLALRSLSENAAALDWRGSQWPVCRTSARTTPFAVGGRRARIVIPDALADRWSTQQLALVIAHEEAHLRRRDPAVTTVLAVTAALFWFNPFLLDLVARWRQCCELRADADALLGATQQQRSLYARTLVAAMRSFSDAKPAQAPTLFTSRKIRRDKMRISAILNKSEKRMRKPASLLVHCAAWLLVAAGSTTALATASGNVDTLDRFISGGRITSAYGVERKNMRRHTGVDVWAEKGTPIAAPGAAVVKQAAEIFRGNPRWGRAVVLEFDDDLVVWFTHLEGYSVKTGDRLDEGDIFATVGDDFAMVRGTLQSQRSHIHIEAYKNGRRVDPATIWPFLKRPGR
ncbi:M23/M56 family metallopeptidase [Hoeflea poritis]|uniref:M23/M56 family metallopeptidase n=1 Tax=Hoeflea poritis TaxID=2993659 RepID=A0ABT4VLF5_9HYPH|nr:M23/M56 family metallopeptidase [Hoeflea poritis]MDA4845500.1 M23/M56 family metallopeptidase [Hoeflea poritis]